MIKRLVLVAALVTGLFLGSPGQPGAVEGALTRMQIRITTSSDWTSVHLEDLDVRARHRVSQASTDAVWDHRDGWTVVRAPAAAEATLVVDLIAELGAVNPAVVVTKGREGVARVEVLATSGDAPEPATEVVVDTRYLTANTVERRVDRAVLLRDELVLGEVDGRNLTLAFYYPWFREDAAADRKVNPDKPASWYATSDPAHVRGMVDEATGAGLDGFLVSWEGELHGEMVQRLLDDVAQRDDFVVAPVLELRRLRTKTVLGERLDSARAAQALADFLERVDAGSRLEVAGRPVVVVFGMWDLAPAEWQAFRAAAAPLDPFVIGDRADPAFLVDGLYHYDPNPRSIDELERTYDESLDQARLEPAVDPAQRQLLWAATVSPGFDNRASNLLFGRRYTDRADGWRYDETWRTALGSRPEWVFVTSWNEWYEQTHISPGRSTGRTALEQTARWTTQFRASPR